MQEQGSISTHDVSNPHTLSHDIHIFINSPSEIYPLEWLQILPWITVHYNDVKHLKTLLCGQMINHEHNSTHHELQIYGWGRSLTIIRKRVLSDYSTDSPTPGTMQCNQTNSQISGNPSFQAHHHHHKWLRMQEQGSTGHTWYISNEIDFHITSKSSSTIVLGGEALEVRNHRNLISCNDFRTSHVVKHACFFL